MNEKKKKYIIKFIIMSILAIFSGFLNGFLKYINIDITTYICTLAGWWECLIFNWEDIFK